MAHVPATTAVAGGPNSRKPPALTMPFASGTGSESHHTRRQSTMSSESSNSDDDDAESSPLTALDSSAALILVHDEDDEEPRSPFDFTDDEDDRDGDADLVSPMFDARKSAVFPSLRPSNVFLYLLSPYLKLGAVDLPNSQLPLKYGLPALLLSALASAFARQIWYMLARYLRKADMADILLDTLAKGRGKERQRVVIRFVARTCTGLLSTLLAITYLRHSMYTLHSVVANERHQTLSYIISTMGVGAAVAYLSYARSLNSTRVLCITWLSIMTYIAWWGCTIYAHTHGLLEERPGWIGSGSVWQGLATTAFAFCSSSTLPLYTSLKSTTSPISTGKAPRSRSFRIISFLSVIAAVLLLLPSVIFAAFPNQLTTFAFPLLRQVIPTNSTFSIASSLVSATPTLNATNVPILSSVPSLSPPLPSDIALPTIQIETARRVLASVTVLLGVPTLIITTPPIALSALRSVKFNVSRVVTILVVFIFVLIPPRSYPSADGSTAGNPAEFYFTSSKLSAAITITVLLMTIIGTYFLPAFLHILIHTFKRPLAIVVPPPSTPLLHTPTASTDLGDAPTSRHSPRTVYDDLLLRKERALQKKQFKKRIIWDIGVWLLVGASAVAVVVLVGGFAGA